MSPVIEPIGVIRTGHTDHDTTPVQTALNRDEPGEIHLEAEYATALEGLDRFSHLWILTWLHRPDQKLGPGAPLVQTPFLLQSSGETLGTFAMRGPRRPNPVGLHLVSITEVSIDPAVVCFRGVDMVDGTPVVDLKPWVSRFDLPEGGHRSGWYDDLHIEKTTPADLAAEKKEQT